jgi:hypothetical protein
MTIYSGDTESIAQPGGNSTSYATAAAASLLTLPFEMHYMLFKHSLQELTIICSETQHWVYDTPAEGLDPGLNHEV